MKSVSITKPPGHCKAAAQRIRQDAERIINRLAGGESVKNIAVEYDCRPWMIRKHVEAVLGPSHWRRVVKNRGPQKGRGYRPTGPAAPQPQVDAGPRCSWCDIAVLTETTICPNCRNVLI